MKWNADYEAKKKETSLEKEAKDEISEVPCTCKDKELHFSDTKAKMDWPREGSTGTNTLIRVLETPSSMIIPPPVVRSILYEGKTFNKKNNSKF